MKILIGLNNKANKNLIVKWIGMRYQLDIMEQKEDLNKEFDLLIVDGPVLEELKDNIKSRKDTETPVFLPVLLITNRDNVKFITKQLWVTVDEIILTPIEKLELSARIEILLRARRLSLLTQKMAITDPLTGLYNRRHFFVIAEREICKVKRNGGSIICLMMDIDHFKRVNDTYGHTVGDIVLKEVAQRIKSCLRDFDIVARYGGEEFVAIIVDLNSSIAKKIAERIRQRVSEKPIEVENNISLPVSISIGVSSQKAPNIDLNTLIKNADKNLYRAKESGRNRIVY
ncbi:GGDEF domain-containing protein [Desulfothermus sp.]